MIVKEYSDMSLDDFESLIENAHFAPDLFGTDDWERRYKQLSVALHPDKYTDPVEKERAERLFKKLATWKLLAETPEVVESGKSTYILGAEVGKGDISTVRMAISGENTTVIAKIGQNTGVSKLLQKEFEVLDLVRNSVKNDLKKRYFPAPIDNFSLSDGRKANIFEFSEGFYTAESIKAKFPDGLDGRHIVWMFKRLMTALGYAHEAGWVHGAPLPPHLLYQTDEHGLKLVDWTLAVKVGQPIIAAPGGYKGWYPSECKAKKGATPATDIYLAAKSMVYLAGGDPVTNIMPDSIPSKLRGYLRGCLLESPSMRPQNAWECVEEMAEMAYRVYGKPSFHVLEM